MTQLSTWTKWWGIWIDAWVCLHYWVVIWVAGESNFHLYCTVYGVCHRQNAMAVRSYSVLDILLPSIIIIMQDYWQALNTYNVCRVSCGDVFNMLLVLSTIFYFHYNIWGFVCSTGPFQYRWLKGYIYSSCYYHHQIGSIHLSHCCPIFRGCVPELFVASYSVTYYIYVPGKPGICFYYYCAVYDECKYSDTFWLAGRTRLFVQNTISLSSLCKLLWRHWTYKMPVRYILSSV